VYKCYYYVLKKTMVRARIDAFFSSLTAAFPPIWRSLFARQGRSPCPLCAPRLYLFLGAAVRTPGRGLHGGGGGAAGRTLNLCTACQPGQAMVELLPANVSVRERGSLPPTSTDGVRFYPQEDGGPTSASVESRHGSGLRAQVQKIPAQFHGRCFNCLSLSHHVATCRLPRRCLRCRGLGHLAVDAPANPTDDATASTTERCFLESDPLAEALCERTAPSAPLTSVDPMLDELAAQLVSRPAAAQAPDSLSPEGLASLWDPSSTAPQCTTDLGSPQSSPVRGTPAAVVAPAEEDSPSPGEAARRLAKFIDEVRVVRQPPLISSPPKHKTPPKRTLPLRSRRITAQQMDHIPMSKRGKVLLMKRMGFLEPSANSSLQHLRTLKNQKNHIPSSLNLERSSQTRPCSI
jgi:hypothetical protein